LCLHCAGGAGECKPLFEGPEAPGSRIRKNSESQGSGPEILRVRLLEILRWQHHSGKYNNRPHALQNVGRCMASSFCMFGVIFWPQPMQTLSSTSLIPSAPL